MAIRLQEHGGMFLVTCALRELSDRDLLALVDSGASATFVAASICRHAGLELVGEFNKTVYVHGKKHDNERINVYNVTVIAGSMRGNGTVFELVDNMQVRGRRLDVIMGRDVLRHFRVVLDWPNSAGSMDAKSTLTGI